MEREQGSWVERFQQKYQQDLFLHLDKLTQKFIWKNKAGIARKIPKKNSEEELAFYNNFYYKS